MQILKSDQKLANLDQQCERKKIQENKYAC